MKRLLQFFLGIGIVFSSLTLVGMEQQKDPQKDKPAIIAITATKDIDISQLIGPNTSSTKQNEQHVGNRDSDIVLIRYTYTETKPSISRTMTFEDTTHVPDTFIVELQDESKPYIEESITFITDQKNPNTRIGFSADEIGLVATKSELPKDTSFDTHLQKQQGMVDTTKTSIIPVMQTQEKDFQSQEYRSPASSVRDQTPSHQSHEQQFHGHRVRYSLSSIPRSGKSVTEKPAQNETSKKTDIWDEIPIPLMYTGDFSVEKYEAYLSAKNSHNQQVSTQQPSYTETTTPNKYAKAEKKP